MPTQIKVEGVIECGKCYRLTEFMRIANMGQKALREAKEKGLTVIYVGRVGWVTGDSFHAFLGRLGDEQSKSKNN
ncbi:hypothetical protein ACYFX5_03740 [Bremerella sp. T1]|uniref:hypothetical protein n=1 Tax=Bremerella sp. TYQ1 TaxID=3119568 RepID=UPI001CCE7C1F|nr:hypothetical protein [Bremerella volcania]UBM37384.1 hypothetical protein LA756_05695 [Bremerella volcania]